MACLILLRFSELHKKEGVILFWNRFYDLCVKRGTKPNPVAKEIGISSAPLQSGSLPELFRTVKLSLKLLTIWIAQSIICWAAQTIRAW